MEKIHALRKRYISTIIQVGLIITHDLFCPVIFLKVIKFEISQPIYIGRKLLIQLANCNHMRYYIFIIMNITNSTFTDNASAILSVLGNPFRIQLVLALSDQEACVCHLESLLKKRQAYISQHLMALRKAGLLETRRDGKFVYYRLSNPRIVDLIRDAVVISGLNLQGIPEFTVNSPLEECICPHCEELTPQAKISSDPLEVKNI